MRKATIAIVICIATLLLAYTGYRGYKVWKQSHWLAMAKTNAAKQDFRNELLALRQVLNLNPQNLEACRMMAALADATHSPSALVWRQRVVDLSPTTFTDRLDLAQTAISARNFTIASNALASASDADKKTSTYQDAIGTLLAVTGDFSGAETHFAEASRLNPEDLLPQLKLALLRLNGSNDLDLAEARITLKRLSLNSTNVVVGNEAKRALIRDAIKTKNFKTAETIAENLVASTNSLFSDRLLRLDALRQSNASAYRSALATCEQDASKSSASLTSMSIWLMQNVSSGDALNWLESLPPDIRTNQPAAVTIAQCQAHLEKWHALESSLKNQNWNDTEFMRHAFLARALAGLSLNEASDGEWGVAMNYSNLNDPKNRNQKGVLLVLYNLAIGWGWHAKAEQALWTLVNQYPEEKWAVPILANELMAEGRTRPLMQLFNLMSKRMPNDLGTKNNLAFTALLLNANEIDAGALAKQAHDAEPQNPSFTSTYAFSLYVQKKYSEALKVIQTLSPKELQSQSVAGYYGLILKANGNTQKAKDYLTLALKSKLLPEESNLFQQALSN